MSLHEELLKELLKNPQTPKENAAVNEIKRLRAEIAKIEELLAEYQHNDD